MRLNLKRNFSAGTQKSNKNEIFINSLCTFTLRVVQQEVLINAIKDIAKQNP